jgi:hypothetical protein
LVALPVVGKGVFDGMRVFSVLVVVFLLSLGTFPSRASESSLPNPTSAASPPPQHVRCGVNAADAVRQARDYLATPGGQSEKGALDCIVQALDDLSAQSSATSVRADNNRVLVAPQFNGPMK